MVLRTGLVRAARLPPFSPSRLSPSLFVRASHDASSRLENFLVPLRYPDQPNAVRRHYLPLVAELERIKAEPSSPPLPPLLTHEQLITIVDLLATSGRPPDLECIRSMFTHLPEYFNFPVTPELHTVVITALVRQRYLPLAEDWMRRIPELPPYAAPTLEHFHAFMKGCPHHVTVSFLRGVILNKMRRAGVRPSNETFSILVACILRNATESKTRLHSATFEEIFADMKSLGLTGDPSFLAPISAYYVEHGLPVDIRKIYAAQFPDITTPGGQAWHNQLVAASQASGVERALEVFSSLEPQGCTATPDVLRAILSHSKDIRDLRRVEKDLDIQAGASEYLVLIENLLRIRKAQEALAVYMEAKESGIVPVAALVGSLIRALCLSERRKPAVHNTNLDSALALYADLDETFPVPSPDSPEALPSSEPSMGPDVDIYTSLLGGLSLSSNIKTAFPIAESLLVDIKARGIPLTAGIKTSDLILKMRNCQTLDDAFDLYRRRRTELTEYGYPIVMHAFSKISLGLGHPDSLEYYFLIVKDMRLAGFRMSERVYVDILRQFGELASIKKKEWRNKNKAYQKDPTTPFPPNLLKDIEAAVRQIHDLVSLDTSIQPEKLVWQQLIDTYQRVGSFGEAYRVWETLRHSKKYTPIAVSSILGGCGEFGEPDLAKRIVSQLMMDGYVLTLHNWNAYVECMCRLHQMTDALKAIAVDMGSPAQPVKADESTVTIMLKLAESRIQTNTILQQIRRNLPELWKTLPQNMEQPP
ncbi:hypothetical protein C8R43DRAFT_1063552 [Mycena crocata]|nr:hypothetical protein C8R43DRAFT_1063552 [Mycena crocata]